MRRRSGWVALAVTLTGCGGDARQGAAAARVDSAGVEIVTSSGTDRPLDWTLERELSLGGADEGVASFTRVYRPIVGSDAAGRIYVLDAQEHRVAVFGPDGSTVRTMGREGEGPGELVMPLTMAVDPSGAVAVFDLGRGGLIRWDAEGRPLERVPFALFSMVGVNRHFAMRSGGLFVATASYRPETGGELIAIPAAGDTTVLAALPDTEPEMVDYGCVALVLPPFFEPGLVWTPLDGGVAWVDGAEYVVDVAGSGHGLTRSIRRGVAPSPATRRLAEIEAGDGLRMRSAAGECVLDPGDLVEGRGFADVLPIISDMVAGPGGEIWIERRVVGRDERGDQLHGPIDVFDGSGAYTGTLPEGTPFPLFILPDGRIGFAEKDDLDIERLVIARVSRSGVSGQPPPDSP